MLTDLIDKWISALRSEAQQRQERQPHPGLAAIVGQLDSAAFRDRIFAEGFAAGYADYRRRLEEEERARAKALYDKLRESPVMLNGLRLFMAGLDAGALFLTIKTMGGLDWSDLVVGPIMLKVRRWFTEKGMGDAGAGIVPLGGEHARRRAGVDGVPGDQGGADGLRRKCRCLVCRFYKPGPTLCRPLQV